MFSLIEGMGAKTIRGSNHSLNHIGFLRTKHFPWEAAGQSSGWLEVERIWKCMWSVCALRESKTEKQETEGVCVAFEECRRCSLAN